MELKATGNTSGAGLRANARSRLSKQRKSHKTCHVVLSPGKLDTLLTCGYYFVVCVWHTHIKTYKYVMPLKYIQ